MRRFAPYFLTFALAGLVLAPAAAAQDQSKAEKTITGEVIDIKCHKGKGHESCATSCVRNGEAAGLKVGDEVYMIVGDFTADKNAKLVEFVAKDVTVTGLIGEADGHKTIKVSKIALAKAEKK